MSTNGQQLSLLFQAQPPLMSVNDIYQTANEGVLQKFKEDRRLERKPSSYPAKALGDYFSMFANTVPDGGLIIIGMENDGSFSGCSKLAQDGLNRIERTRDIYCPDARYDYKRIAVSRADGEADFVMLFRVFYRADKVVKTVSGDAFVRVGESKTKLSSEEVRELEIDKGQVDLEQEPSGFTYPQDFDLDLVRQFAANYRTNRGLADEITSEEILELRHLGKITAGVFSPNVACALLFARDPLSRFPGCKIRFLRFDGEKEGTGDKFNAVKDIWIDEGSIPKQIVEAERVLDAQIRDFSRLGADGIFYTAPEYPKVAWYEAIVNACVHRSYGLRNMNIFIKMFDDRLEIESPGAFPPLVTPENIFYVHHPRNPYLMDAMFYLKFVKCAHEGTRRIRDTMAEMSLPQPEFAQKEKQEDNFSQVRVTLRNNIKHRKVWIDKDASHVIGEAIFKTLSQDERRVINFIVEYGNISVSQVQRLTGRTWHSAKKLLLNLKLRDILIDQRNPALDRDPGARFFLRTTPPRGIRI
jgi:ATP-dependent DNA helicase RecG